MRTEFVNVGGTRLRVLRGGRGPTLVLLHGLGASLEWWEDAAGLLASSYSVLVPDLPGHGLSEEPDDEYSLSSARGAIADLLDAFTIPNAILGGNSMGGLIALDFALHHPQRVASLLLVANAGFGRRLGPALRLATLPGVGEAALLFTRHEPTARAAFGRLFCDRRRMSADWLRRVVRLCRRRSYARAFLGCLRYGVTFGGLRRDIIAGVGEPLPQLTMPVLLLWGEQDDVIPVGQARSALALLPSARLEVLPGCGHVPQVELPRETCARIASFLRDALPP